MRVGVTSPRGGGVSDQEVCHFVVSATLERNRQVLRRAACSSVAAPHRERVGRDLLKATNDAVSCEEQAMRYRVSRCTA